MSENSTSWIANFIWSIADLVSYAFRRGEYEKVILPFTVLRRLDCVLAPTKQKVLAQNAKLKQQGLKNVHNALCKASGYAFYNTSRYDFSNLLEDHANLGQNLRNHITGFSDNMRLVLEKFDFENTIARLEEPRLLFKVMERFAGVDLHPDKVDNHTMGSVFEELIRKFNEALDENPGEHFTPRDVIRLMVSLMLAPDQDTLKREHLIRSVDDPCGGSGGMLTITKEHILGISPKTDVHLFGQEVNPQTWAVCVSDLLMTSKDGRDAENIKFGSTLSQDQLAEERFDYQLTNPPYGYDWRKDEDAVRAEYAKGAAGRFSAGLPRISDGQLLFLQHMLGRMKPPKDGGSRVCIIMNGSPLFTGDAGSGESEIRRWIIENDWLEAIVALPEQLFYNTGIATYIWVLSNRKLDTRKGKIQLINATDLWESMRKSLGNKRRRISDDQARAIVELYRNQKPDDRCRIFDAREFGYRKITVERPLRLNFQATHERIERIKEQSAFKNLAISRKKDKQTQAKEEAEGARQQQAILVLLASLPGTLYKNREKFVEVLAEAEEKADLRLSAPLRKAVLEALSERDETAEICRDKHGNPEPDPELRDYENVPLNQDINEYFQREVAPHVPDVWVNTAVCDEKDGQVGKVGYEINFNRYFYKYVPPRPLEVIEAEIDKIEDEIAEMLKGKAR